MTNKKKLMRLTQEQINFIYDQIEGKKNRMEGLYRYYKIVGHGTDRQMSGMRENICLCEGILSAAAEAKEE